MQVKPISAVPASDSGDRESLRSAVLSVLSIGELAVALAASDMMMKKTKLTDDERVEFAMQGLARLGMDGLRELHERTSALDLRYEELADRSGGRVPVGSPECKALDKVQRTLWGGLRCEDRAFGAAWAIEFHRVWLREQASAVAVAPISAPPATMTTALPRCLACGHRTATAHPGCVIPMRTCWMPCADCAGLRVDGDGVECRTCCGVGFIDDDAIDTLAERAGEPVIF